QDLAESFDSLTYSQDWPFGSPVVFAQREVFRAAQEAGIKTLLSGHGADTFFAGSPWLWVASLARNGRLRQAVRFIRLTNSAGNVPAHQLALAALGHMMAPMRVLARQLMYRPPKVIRTSWFRSRWVTIADSEQNRGHYLLRSAMHES